MRDEGRERVTRGCFRRLAMSFKNFKYEDGETTIPTYNRSKLEMSYDVINKIDEHFQNIFL